MTQAISRLNQNSGHGRVFCQVPWLQMFAAACHAASTRDPVLAGSTLGLTLSLHLRSMPLQSYHSRISRLSNHPSYRQDERTVYGLYKPLQHSTTSVCSCHVLFDMHGIDACLFCCPSPKQGLAACGSLSIYQYHPIPLYFQSAAHR